MREDVVVRDSAGIEIVEFDATSMQLPESTASDSAAVTIGVLEGEPEYMLEHVEQALRLRDGRIVVADGGPNELRFYDASGRHLLTTGGNGEGPGEFRSFWSVQLGPGDSIHVWDYALRRLSVIAPDGSFVRSMSIGVDGEIPATPRLAGVLPDGRLLVSMWYAWGAEPPAPNESRILRDPVPIIVYSATGSPEDTLGEWPGTEAYISSYETIIAGPAPFGRNTTISSADDFILIADDDRWQLVFIDPVGATRRIMRDTRAAEPVSDADIARYRAYADEPDVPQSFRDRFLEAPMPATYPAFGPVVVSTDGAIWVADYRTAWAEGARRWLVVDSTGPVARAVTPATLDKVYAVGDDWVLGLRKDEFDVQQVVLLRLRKPAP